MLGILSFINVLVLDLNVSNDNDKYVTGKEKLRLATQRRVDNYLWPL